MKSSDELGWRVEETVSPHTGKVRRIYFFRGRKAYRLVWDSHIARQLAGWSLIEKDLRNISEWNRILIDLVQEVGDKKMNLNKTRGKIGTPVQAATMKALTVSIIAFYGKLFTEAKGRRVVLQRMSVPEDFRKLHDTLIGMRHSYVAHAGEEGHEEAAIAIALDSNESRWTPHRIFTEIQQANNLIPDDLQKFSELADCLREDAKLKIKLLASKIDKEISELGESPYDRVRKPKQGKRRF